MLSIYNGFLRISYKGTNTSTYTIGASRIILQGQELHAKIKVNRVTQEITFTFMDTGEVEVVAMPQQIASTFNGAATIGGYGNGASLTFDGSIDYFKLTDLTGGGTKLEFDWRQDGLSAPDDRKVHNDPNIAMTLVNTGPELITTSGVPAVATKDSY